MNISKNAQDFVKSKENQKVKRISVLEQYKDDIFYLKDNNIPITKIVEFLKDEHNVKTSYPNLLNWIKRNNDKKIENTIDTNIKKPINENISKYDNVDGTLKKHNLDSQIKRPSI